MSVPLGPLLPLLGAGLATAYAAVPSTTLAVVALTVVLHAATFPLTRRARRTQRRVAAELAERSGDADRAAYLAEQGAASLLGGLVPVLLQAPIFLAMYQLLRTLADGSTALLPAASELARAVRSGGALSELGVDLTNTGLAAMTASPAAAVAFLGLAAVSIVASLLQLRRSPARPPALAHVLPLLAVGWGLAVPLTVTIYTATSSILRLLADRIG